MTRLSSLTLVVQSVRDSCKWDLMTRVTIPTVRRNERFPERARRSGHAQAA